MKSLVDLYLSWLKAGSAEANTIDDRRKLLTRLERELPYGLEVATTDELAEWLSNPGWQQTTRATYYSGIRAFYLWACDPNRPEGLDYDPSAGLRKVRHPAGVPRPVSDAELARLLTTGRPWIVYVHLAAFGGLRCIEMSRLDRQHVTEEWMRVRGKGNKTRIIATHPAVWEVMQGLPAGPVARRRDGSRASSDWISTATAQHIRRTLDMPGVTLHRLRHWFATTQLSAGASIRAVQDNLGHANLASTQIYTAVAAEVRGAAVRSLPMPGR